MNRWGGIAGSVAFLIALGLSGTGALEAQQRQERVAPERDAPAVDAAQAEVLMERFAQRIAQALRLDGGQARRLRRELQTSRRERAGIAARTRDVRRELNQLIQQGAVDEARIELLLDELLDLQAQAAMVPIDEQRRFAEFLSPLQRARYLYLRQRLVRQALNRQGAQTDIPPRDDLPPDFRF